MYKLGILTQAVPLVKTHLTPEQPSPGNIFRETEVQILESKLFRYKLGMLYFNAQTRDYSLIY